MKKLLSVLLILSLVSAVGMFAVSCELFADEKKPSGDTPVTPGTATAESTSYVVLDINPTLELTLSETNVVLSADASNDDAEVLLSEVAVEGKPLEEATEEIADASVELGFIEENVNTEISVTVCGENAEQEEALYKRIKEKISHHVKEKHNINLGVERDALLTLRSELETLKSENPDNEKIQSLNIARYRMIVSAMEKDSTLTLEAALELTTRELIGIIKEKSMKDFDAELDKLEMELEQKYEREIDNIYFTFDNLLLSAKATELLVLREIEHSLEAIEECELETYKTIRLTEENVLRVATMLGLDETETASFKEDCKTLEGAYSVRNMEYAINRMYRNLPPQEREAFEELYDEVIEEYLETLEESVDVPQEIVNAVKASAQQFVTMTGKTEFVIPEAITTLEELDAFLERFEDLVEEVIEEKEEALEHLIETLGLEEEYEKEKERIEREEEEAERAFEKEANRHKEEKQKEKEEFIQNWHQHHAKDKE